MDRLDRLAHAVVFTVPHPDRGVSTQSDSYLILFDPGRDSGHACACSLSRSCAISVITYFHVQRQHPETPTYGAPSCAPSSVDRDGVRDLI